MNFHDRFLSRLDTCAGRVRNTGMLTVICGVLAIMLLMGTSSPMHAVTIDEIAWIFGGTIPMFSSVTISNTLQYTTRIENLVVGETVYDVVFKRGTVANVFDAEVHSTDFHLEFLEEPPKFWGNEQGATDAAKAIMEALGDDKRTFGTAEPEDTFAVLYDGNLDLKKWKAKGDTANEDLVADTLGTLSITMGDLDSGLIGGGYIFATFTEPTAMEVALRLGYVPPPPTPSPLPDSIPEPSTLLLLGTGLGGLLVAGRKTWFTRGSS